MTVFSCQYDIHVFKKSNFQGFIKITAAIIQPKIKFLKHNVQILQAC